MLKNLGLVLEVHVPKKATDNSVELVDQMQQRKAVLLVEYYE